MSRTVLVTGGAKGIGLAIAEEFSNDHDVVIVWNTEPPKAISPGIHMIQADLTKEGSCKAVIDGVMAKELGPVGIRVNAVAPGAIAVAHNPRPSDLTELFVKETALGRPGQPDDIAPVVRFLSSDAARFITGEILTVSGGYRL